MLFEKTDGKNEVLKLKINIKILNNIMLKNNETVLFRVNKSINANIEMLVLEVVLKSLNFTIDIIVCTKIWGFP